MIYECQISYVAVDDKGNDKNVKENYVIAESESFGDVEQRMYDQFSHLTGFDVAAIKRSRVKEIANNRQDKEDKIWMAELMDTFVDDAGVEKQIKYKILFYSHTFDTAKAFICQYARQGYNLELVSLKLTRFIDVIE